MNPKERGPAGRPPGLPLRPFTNGLPLGRPTGLLGLFLLTNS
jgi:hypothetical protein